MIQLELFIFETFPFADGKGKKGKISLGFEVNFSLRDDTLKVVTDGLERMHHLNE